MLPDFDELAGAAGATPLPLGQRAAAWRERLLRERPETGAFILSMSDEPLAASAFGGGEPWERWVAELLRRTFPLGIFLFNRVRGPGLLGTIDIVAVLPSGVWAIDVQRFDAARVEIRGRPPGPGRADRLVIDGTDRTALLDDLDEQSGAVAGALAAAGFRAVTPRSALCLVDADPGWRGHPLVGSTHVAKPRPMLKVLRAGPVVLDESDVASVGLALDRRLARQRRRF